jgi:hypothetical protein
MGRVPAVIDCGAACTCRGSPSTRRGADSSDAVQVEADAERCFSVRDRDRAPRRRGVLRDVWSPALRRRVRTRGVAAPALAGCAFVESRDCAPDLQSRTRAVRRIGSTFPTGGSLGACYYRFLGERTESTTPPITRPIPTPIPTPKARPTPMLSKATPKAAPKPAPKEMPNPNSKPTPIPWVLRSEFMA